MEWIDSEEMLPNEKLVPSKEILCYTNEGIHSARFLEGFHEFGIVGGMESCCYCGGESRVTFMLNMVERHCPLVTHWMKLPEPPNECSKLIRQMHEEMLTKRAKNFS